MMGKSEYILHDKILATVCIRRDWPVKPEAECLEGLELEFNVLWKMDDFDSYPGEYALELPQEQKSLTGLVWIASGDVKH